MCNHKIIINIMLCLLNSRLQDIYKSRSIVDPPTYDDTRNRSIHLFDHFRIIFRHILSFAVCYSKEPIHLYEMSISRSDTCSTASENGHLIFLVDTSGFSWAPWYLSSMTSTSIHHRA